MNPDLPAERSEKPMKKAAQAYVIFWCDNPNERAAMQAWESAPLVDFIEPPKPQANPAVPRH